VKRTDNSNDSEFDELYSISIIFDIFVIIRSICLSF